MSERLQGPAAGGRPDTRLLVLGSFPGVASLAGAAVLRPSAQPLLADCCRRSGARPGRRCPTRARWPRLTRRGARPVDVYAACRREGSLDSAIEAAEPNDLAALQARAPALRGGGPQRRRIGAVDEDHRGAGPAGLPPAVDQPGQRELVASNASGRPGAKSSNWPVGLTEPNGDGPRRKEVATIGDDGTRDLPPVTLSEHDGVRYLHLGTPWVQGAMRMAQAAARGARLRAAHAGQPAVDPQCRAGRGPRRAARPGGRRRSRASRCQALKMPTTVVEINPQVVAVPAAPGSACPRTASALQVVVADAGRWLAGAPLAARQVQLLHVDLYDHEAAAPVLDDEAFYAACRALLATGGADERQPVRPPCQLRAAAWRASSGAFGASQVWSLRPTREGNTVVVAGRAVVVPGRDELAARAATIEDRFARLGPAGAQVAAHGAPLPGSCMTVAKASRAADRLRARTRCAQGPKGRLDWRCCCAGSRRTACLGGGRHARGRRVSTPAIRACTRWCAWAAPASSARDPASRWRHRGC